jgi:hypothetical protein
MRKISKYGTHGDVQVINVAVLGETPDLSKMKKLDTNVLAHGEVTGHMHALAVPHEGVREFAPSKSGDKETFQVYEDDQGQMYLQVDQDTILSHQEHLTTTVEPGLYKINITREYNPFTDIIDSVRD